MYKLFLIGLAYYNCDTWFKIDKKHRKYYITFIISAICCVAATLISFLKHLESNTYLIVVSYLLMGITMYQKRNMLIDLKNGKYLKENDDKNKR